MSWAPSSYLLLLVPVLARNLDTPAYKAFVERFPGLDVLARHYKP